MNKVESFKQAYKYLTDYAGEHYMSNSDNWCVVHVTKYMPRKHDNGTLYIPSTAMATNFDIPRTTVHTTFNHIVRGHMMGNWDDTPIVILTPYSDIVKANGKPAEISAVDTYWSVDPNQGLVLSEKTYIVQPSNDVLYSINENGATYKRDNFTEEEIQTILNMLSPSELELYNKYKNGDFEDYEIKQEFYSDERIKKMYESAKDKRAFLRGLFEESRFDILAHFLRDAVVRMAMEKMGFREAKGLSDGSRASEAVAETAYNMGIRATASDKGHSNSIYSDMEYCWGNIKALFYGGFDKYGLLTAKNTEEQIDWITEHIDNHIMKSIVKSLIENQPLDIFKLYEQRFLSSIESRKSWIDCALNTKTEELKYIENYQISEEEKEQRRLDTYQEIKNTKQTIKYLESIKKIADYDPYLAETLQKNAKLLSSNFETWRKTLQSSKDYQSFMNKLRQVYNSVSVKTILDKSR